MYQMLFGILPWSVSISNYEMQMSGDTIATERLLQQREQPLLSPEYCRQSCRF